MAAEIGEIPNTLTFSIPMGGQSGTLMFFLKSVTYWPTLSKFRGGPVKRNTLYVVVIYVVVRGRVVLVAASEKEMTGRELEPQSALLTSPSSFFVLL